MISIHQPRNGIPGLLVYQKVNRFVFVVNADVVTGFVCFVDVEVVAGFICFVDVEVVNGFVFVVKILQLNCWDKCLTFLHGYHEAKRTNFS